MYGELYLFGISLERIVTGRGKIAISLRFVKGPRFIKGKSAALESVLSSTGSSPGEMQAEVLPPGPGPGLACREMFLDTEFTASHDEALQTCQEILLKLRNSGSVNVFAVETRQAGPRFQTSSTVRFNCPLQLVPPFCCSLRLKLSIKICIRGVLPTKWTK